MANLPLVLFVALLAAAMLAPLRWSMVAFLLLSNIDLGSQDASIGLLNTIKAMLLPPFLLWRLRGYSGFRSVRLAPVAWCMLVLYVCIASTWSLFPMYALKLVGHMVGSLIICLMLMKATKGGFVRPQIIVPVALGAFILALLHWVLLPDWGGEIGRFTSFSTAQAFAAFVTALFCVALSTSTIRFAVRAPLCVLLAVTVLVDGSRIWITGMAIATLIALAISEVKAWVKVLAIGSTLIAAALVFGALDNVMREVARSVGSNRIAAALTAVYEGDIKSSGLGTYNFRHEMYRRTTQAILNGSLVEILFGHGTSNGFLIAVTLNRDADPNRALHDEWLRAMYEWGVTGLLLWLVFIGSLIAYGITGVRQDRAGYSKPLLIYLPAFILGLSGENIIAGAGNSVSVGLLLLIAFASISHRNHRLRPVLVRSFDIRDQRIAIR